MTRTIGSDVFAFRSTPVGFSMLTKDKLMTSVRSAIPADSAWSEETLSAWPSPAIIFIFDFEAQGELK